MPSTLEDFIHDLQRSTLKARDLMRLGLIEGAKVFKEALLITVPVRTGKLRDSIEVEITDQGQIIITALDYGLTVEYGRSNLRPHPWIKEAIEKSWDRAQEAMTKVVMDGLTKIIMGGG